MSQHTFYAWDDAARKAEPELTVEQCDAALRDIRALEGHPGIARILHYLRGVQRTAGEALADVRTPVEMVRYNQGIYDGLKVTLAALTVPLDQADAGETDCEAAQWYRRVMEQKRELAEGGQS
ncbi:MAG: hypothetical protein ACYDCO_01795 [Armatimonadota bacterium]